MLKDREKTSFFKGFVVSFSWYLIVLTVCVIVFYLLGLRLIPLLLISSFTLSLILLFFKIFVLRIKMVLDRSQIFLILWLIVLAVLNYVFHHEPLMGDNDVGEYASSAYAFFKWGITTSHAFPVYSLFISLPLFLNQILGVNFFDIYMMNSLLVFLSLGFIYLILSEFFLEERKNRFVWNFFIINVCAWIYPFVWFSRRTLSENLWFFLFFVSLYYFLGFIRRKRGELLIYSLCPALLAFVVRVEAQFLIFLILFYAGVIIFRSQSWSKMTKQILKNKVSILFVVLILILSYFFFFNGEYSKIHYLSGYLNKSLYCFFPGLGGFSEKVVTYETHYPTYKNFLSDYIKDTFLGYGLAIPIMFVFINFFSDLFKIIYQKKGDNYVGYLFLEMLCLFFLIILLMEPSTGFTQPWFLRHFWVPVITLSWIIFLSRFPLLIVNKYGQLGLISGLICFIMTTSAPVIFLADYRGSYDFLVDFAEEVKKENLSWKTERNIYEPDSSSEILLVKDYLLRNYGLSLGYMTNTRVLSLTDFLRDTEEFRDYDDFYILTGRDFSLDDSLDLGFIELLRCSYFKTEKLNFLREAHSYAKNYYVPPIHLDEGYAPFARTIELLPPRAISEYEAELCLYRLISKSE